jgi:hypothetical protein
VDTIPKEIQEYILRLWLLCDEPNNIRSVMSTSDIRWLDDSYVTMFLTRKCGETLLKDIIEFEMVLCRCGKTKSDPRPPAFLRHGRHISFCNILYLKIGLFTLQKIDQTDVQLAFDCMAALMDFEIQCMDDDMQVVHLVSRWLINIHGIKIVRFNSWTVEVSDIYTV